MINSLFRSFIILILALFTGAAGAAPQKPAVNSTTDGVAVRGYDVVAYQDGQVVEGDARYERVWNGARWRFSSAANRDRFAAAPEKFAPQFGGYCAYAVSRGYTADIDPKAFKIVDGALYLNYSLGVQRSWERHVQGNIVKGRQNWPAVLNK